MPAGFGTTYYVDVNYPGSDSNDGLTETTPWLTIQHALDYISAGDTVYIKAGTYTQSSLTMITAGDSNNYINISRFSNSTVVVINFNGGTGWTWNGYKDYIVINGLDITNSAAGHGIKIQGNYNEINNCKIYSCGTVGQYSGLAIIGGSNNVIYNNEIRSSGKNGIYIETQGNDGASGLTDNNIISSNLVYSNAYGSGIVLKPNIDQSLETSTSNVIKYNKIYSNTGYGLEVDYQITPDIFSNLIYKNSSTGIMFNSTAIVLNEVQPAGNVDYAWYDVRMDSDSSHILFMPLNGYLYISANFGFTWTARSPIGALNWREVGMDSDGSFIIASHYTSSNGAVYISSNSGVSWTAVTPNGILNEIWSVACDADGSHLMAGGHMWAYPVVGGGRLYTSTTSGAKWAESRPVGDVNRIWSCLCSDADGSFLIAAHSGTSGSEGRLYTSSDYGVIWTERQPMGNLNRTYDSIACSSTGQYIILTVKDPSSGTGGRLYTSSNYGVNWTERQPEGNNNVLWTEVSCNSTGAVMYASAGTYLVGQGIYKSINYGVSWTHLVDTAEDWQSVATNAVGDKYACGVYYGRAYAIQNTAGNTSGANVIGNTINQNTIGIDVYSDSPVYIKNNIITNNSIYALNYTNYPASNSVDYNLYFGNVELFSVYGSDYVYLDLRSWQEDYRVDNYSQETDPLYTSLSTDVYTLSKTSPAINAGTSTVGATYDTDIIEIPRPQGLNWDIGAYEYQFPSIGTYYVDSSATSGNNTGVNWENAWINFNSIRWNLVLPQSTIYVSGGTTNKTYDISTSTIQILTSGISTTYPTTLMGAVDLGHSGEVILDRKNTPGPAILVSGLSYVVIDNFTINNAWSVSAAGGAVQVLTSTGTTVKNCSIHVNKGSGVEFYNVSNGLIDNNTLTTSNYTTNKTNFAYVVGGSGNTISDNTITISNYLSTADIEAIYLNNNTNSSIQRNKIYLNTGAATQYKDGIYCINNYGITSIVNNLVYSIGTASNSTGIAFLTTSNYTGTAKIYNNTVYVTNSNTMPVKLQDTYGNNTDRNSYVINNIFYKNGTGYTAFYPTTFTSTNRCNFNEYHNASGTLIQHTSTTDTWASWTGLGYEASGLNMILDFNTDYSVSKISPTIDAGQSLAFDAPTDVNGVTRPQGPYFDMGAYESRKGYYVDNLAIGISDGRDWNNAWTNLDQVNWELFAPGDTLYISGGDQELGESKTYPGFLNVTALGREDLPISILPGLDYGHDGQPIIDGNNLTIPNGIVVENNAYIIISGITLVNHSVNEIYTINTASLQVLNCNFLFYGRGISASYTTDLLIKDCSLTSALLSGRESDGLYLQDCADAIVDGNYVAVYNSYLYGANDCIEMIRCTNPRIFNNYIIQDTSKTSNSRALISSNSTGNIYIYNNVVDMNKTISEGIMHRTLTYSPPSSLNILNNTIYGENIVNGIYVEGFSNPIIKNNIVSSGGKSYVMNLKNYSGSAGNIDYNLYYNSYDSRLFNINNYQMTFFEWTVDLYQNDTHGYNVNPLFVSELNGNLQLQANSPAKDVGVSLSGLFTTDINDVTRPYGTAWDIGAYEGPGYDTVPPRVVGLATITNGNTVEVFFSEPLIKKDAETISNYFIYDTGDVGFPNPSILAVSYSAVGTTYKVTIITGFQEYSSYQVVVSNVKDLAGNLIDPDANSTTYYYYYVDTTRPRLIKVDLLNNTTLKLTFDERLNFESAQNYKNYYITKDSEIIISVYAAIYNSAENVVTLITSDHFPGTFTITVDGNVTDVAGNPINSLYNSLSYTVLFVDTVGPRLLETYAASSNVVYAKFNEAIRYTTLIDENNYSISGLTILSSDPISMTKPLETYLSVSGLTDGVTYTLVVASGLTDLSYNSIDENYDSLQFTYTESPKISSVVALNNTTLRVTFTKEMLFETLLDPDNYIISGLGTASVLEVSGKAGDAVVVLDVLTTKHTASGLYTLTINNALSADVSEEMVAPYNYGTYTIIGDYTPPEVIEAELLYSTCVRVKFSERLYPPSSTNTAQYTIEKLTVSGYLRIDYVYINDVYAYVYTPTHGYAEDFRITVSGVQDLYGNTITTNNSAIYSYAVSGIQVNLTSPVGSEEYYNGQYKPITWTMVDQPTISDDDATTELLIQFSSNNGNSWSTVVSGLSISNGNDSYDWIVPDIATVSGLIRLTDLNSGTILDTSSNFSIQSFESITNLIIFKYEDPKLIELQNWALSTTWCSRAVIETFSNVDFLKTYSETSTLVVDEYYNLTVPRDALPNTEYTMLTRIYSFVPDNPNEIVSASINSTRWTLQIGAKRYSGNDIIKMKFCTNPGTEDPLWFTWYDTSTTGATTLPYFSEGFLDYSKLEMQAYQGDIFGVGILPTVSIQVQLSITTDSNGNGGYIDYFALLADPDVYTTDLSWGSATYVVPDPPVYIPPMNEEQ